MVNFVTGVHLLLLVGVQHAGKAGSGIVHATLDVITLGMRYGRCKVWVQNRIKHLGARAETDEEHKADLLGVRNNIGVFYLKG